MRKAKQLNFFQKMGDYVSKKLTFLMEVENWENQELSEKSGIPQNRLSEIKNKKRAMTDLWLKALIAGGVISVDDIVKSVPLDSEEKAYLNDLKFFEHKSLIASIKAALADGVDDKTLTALINQAREEHKKG